MSQFTSLTVQSVLFHTPVSALERALASIDRASQLGQRAGRHGLVNVAYGDCSPSPTFSRAAIEELNARHPGIGTISYEFFNQNLGHGGAQNRLARSTATDLLVTANPDVVVSRHAFGALVDLLDDRTVGIAEAKQLPFEHPKEYDRETGDTSWASGAFSMFRVGEFIDIGGFDSSSFFLHGDDVDLSWRFRMRRFRIIHQPAACVFHDKRLGSGGEWQAPAAERYYSAESALFLSYKWSRDDVLEPLLAAMSASPDDSARRAATEFLRRRASGDMPDRLDPHGEVAEFVAGAYGPHRW